MHTPSRSKPARSAQSPKTQADDPHQEAIRFIDHLTQRSLTPIGSLAVLVRAFVETGHALSHLQHIGDVMQLIEEQIEQHQQLVSLEAAKFDCAYEAPPPPAHTDQACAANTAPKRRTRQQTLAE